MNEQKFSAKSTVYEKARPSYPKEIIDLLFAKASPDIVIADVRSGTGKFTELLLERGYKVFAVEPNDDMRGAAEKKLVAKKNFVSVNGSAENTTLAPKSVDYITVAQAFHWFDVDAFRAECKRILRKNGQAILIWNAFSADTKQGKAWDDFLRSNCPAFKGFGGGVQNESDRISRFFGGKFEVAEHVDKIAYDKEGLINRALSGSYTPKAGDANYQAFVEKVARFFDENQIDGLVTFANVTRAYFGAIKKAE